MTSSSSVTQHRELRGGRSSFSGDAIRTEHHLVHHPIVDRGEQLLLRRDVVVEGAFAEPVDRAQLRDAGGVVAAPGEDLRGRVDDRVAPRRPLLAAPGIRARAQSPKSIVTGRYMMGDV
jgi:hypothetical protein